MNNTLHSNPALQHVVKLLEQSHLIASDLDDKMMANFYAIYNTDELVGVIGLEVIDSDGLLRSLAVAQTARGQKIGKQLVDAIEQHAQQLSISTLYLLTNDADNYFRKVGYRDCPREKTPETIKQSTQFSQLCPANAIVMCKHLT